MHVNELYYVQSPRFYIIAAVDYIRLRMTYLLLRPDVPIREYSLTHLWVQIYNEPI